MRWTPHLMILLGVLLLLWGYNLIHFGIMSEGLARCVKNSANAIADRMDHSGLQRVFDMPPDVTDTRSYVMYRSGLHWAEPVRRAVTMNVLGSLGLATVLIVWGLLELAHRKRARAIDVAAPSSR